MSLVDIAALVLIGLSTLHGCLRGLSGELAHFLSVVSAFAFGLWLHQPLALWMLTSTRLEGRPAQAVAFATSVTGALVALILVRFAMRRIMKVVIEEEFDRIGGGIAGFIRSTVIVIIVFILLNMWPHEYLNRKFGEESLIGAAIRPHIPMIEDKLEGI